jgi:hypothetical protein
MLSRVYRQQAKLVQGSEELFWIRWYWTDPEAPWLPFPTVFTSSVYDPESVDADIGFQGDRDDTHQSPPGTCQGAINGEESWFVDGIPEAAWNGPDPDSECGCPVVYDLAAGNPLDNEILFGDDPEEVIQWGGP